MFKITIKYLVHNHVQLKIFIKLLLQKNQNLYKYIYIHWASLRALTFYKVSY